MARGNEDFYLLGGRSFKIYEVLKLNNFSHKTSLSNYFNGFFMVT